MKKYTIIQFMLLFLASGAMILNSCKYKNPTEGFQVIIKADATSAPNTFRVIDAKTNLQANIPNNTPVTITGKDAAFVYSPGGSKNIKVFQGFVMLSLRRGVVPSEVNPIEFNINLAPAGFLPTTYPVRLTIDEPINGNIALIDLNNLPNGCAKTEVKLPMGTDHKTTVDTAIAVNPGNGFKGTATLKLKKGASFKYPDGTIATGEIQASLIAFEPTPETYKAIGSSLTPNAIIDSNGNVVNGGTITPLSIFYLSIKESGPKKAGSLGYELDIAMPGPGLPSPAGLSMEYPEEPPSAPGMGAFALGGGYGGGGGASGGGGGGGGLGMGGLARLGGLAGAVGLGYHEGDNNKQIVFDPETSGTYAFGTLDQKCGTPLNLGVLASDNKTVRIEIKKGDDIDNLIPHETKENVQLKKGPNVVKFNTNLGKDTKYQVKIYNPTEITGSDLDHVGPHGKLCDVNNPITLDPDPENKYITFNIFIKCSNGNAVVLPKNTIVYFINNNTYNTTIINGGPTGPHKCDPADNIPGTNRSYWNAAYVDEADVTVDGKTTRVNVLRINKNFFQPDQSYRFSVYYDNDGNGSREDQVFPKPEEPSLNQQAIDGMVENIIDGRVSNPTSVTVILKSCPF
jgi:hypothetical protein